MSIATTKFLETDCNPSEIKLIKGKLPSLSGCYYGKLLRGKHWKCQNGTKYYINNRILISRHRIEGLLHWKNVINFAGGNMANTSKDGLLLGVGIHHITARSCGCKQVPACIRLHLFTLLSVADSTTATVC